MAFGGADYEENPYVPIRIRHLLRDLKSAFWTANPRNLRDGTLRHYRESIKQIYKRVPSDTLISDLDEYTMIGTRGNVADPLGRIEEQYWDNTRCRFTVILVLDENDESNFNYKYGLSFGTLYYQDMKERIEDAA